MPLNTTGCYTYQGTLTLDGLGGYQVSDTRGIAAETVLVQAGVPSVSTVASSGTNRPGTTVSDTVTITGLTAASSYTWTLYGPVAPVAGACDAVDWTGAQIVDSGSFPVDPATTVYTTPDRTVSAVGCYSYGGNLASTGSTVEVPLAAGVPAETFLIEKGRVIAAATREIDIDKSGMEAFVTRAAQRHGFAYGLTAVLLSLILGWAASAAFKRLRE